MIHPQTKRVAQNISTGMSTSMILLQLKEQGIGYFQRKKILKEAHLLREESQKKAMQNKEGVSIKLHTDAAILDYSILDQYGLDKGQRKEIYKKFKKNPADFILARINLKNGMQKSFIAQQQKGGVYYQEGFYVIDNQSGTFDVDSGLTIYEYHQDLALPLKKELEIDHRKIKTIHLSAALKVNVQELREILQESGLLTAKFGTHPVYLNMWLKDRSVQKILLGAEEEAFFKFIKVAMIVTILLSVMTLILVIVLAIFLFRFMKGAA